jgi:hypothetical protein
MDTNEYKVDMKSGLEALQGMSDSIRQISETVLSDRVPERQSHKSNIRTNLKNTFEGSWGQVFSLDIYNIEQNTRLQEITRERFVKLIHFFLKDALYLPTEDLWPDVKEVVLSLGGKAEKLREQLRKSALKKIHDVSDKFNIEMKLRYRRSWDSISSVMAFNDETSAYLKPRLHPERVQITASITRLNITTGNGRLLCLGDEETTAFGFVGGYSSVRISAKKIFSENLNYNNGLDSEGWKLLNLVAMPLKLRSGKVIKYIVVGVAE